MTSLFNVASIQILGEAHGLSFDDLRTPPGRGRKDIGDVHKEIIGNKSVTVTGKLLLFSISLRV